MSVSLSRFRAPPRNFARSVTFKKRLGDITQDIASGGSISSTLFTFDETVTVYAVRVMGGYFVEGNNSLMRVASNIVFQAGTQLHAPITGTTSVLESHPALLHVADFVIGSDNNVKTSDAVNIDKKFRFRRKVDKGITALFQSESVVQQGAGAVVEWNGHAIIWARVR